MSLVFGETRSSLPDAQHHNVSQDFLDEMTEPSDAIGLWKFCEQNGAHLRPSSDRSDRGIR